MASGDPVAAQPSVGGSSSAIVSVPSGEEWVISGVSTWKTRLNAADGSGDDKWLALEKNSRTDYDDKPLDQRPVFTPSVEPKLNNQNCSSLDLYLGGRELNGNVQVFTGSLGGGSSTTFNVPSGEGWVARGRNTYDMRLVAHDGGGQSDWIYLAVNGHGADYGAEQMAQRPVFTNSVQPNVQNENCTTQDYYAAFTVM